MSKEQQFRAGVLPLIWWIATAVSGLLDTPAVWNLLIGLCPFRGQLRRLRPRGCFVSHNWTRIAALRASGAIAPQADALYHRDIECTEAFTRGSPCPGIEKPLPGW